MGASARAGLIEELALERLAADWHAQEAAHLWRQRNYAAAKREAEQAIEANRHVERLAAQLHEGDLP